MPDNTFPNQERVVGGFAGRITLLCGLLSIVASELDAAPVTSSNGETIIVGGQAAEVTTAGGVKVVSIKETPEQLRRALDGTKFGR